MKKKEASGPSHLPVAIVVGISAQDTADLHIGKLLLQNFNYIPNTQLSTDRHTVKHLKRKREKERQD